jgi:glycosyltransferase involved in cell wall biosynthesis
LNDACRIPPKIMQKKICVMTSAHPAFDARIFHKQCRSLAAAGYQVTLVAPHSQSLVRDGVQLRATRIRKNRLQRATLGVWEVFRFAIRERADVYHFHDPELIPAGLVLRLLGRKVIYDVHEDLPGTFSYKQYIPRWLKKPLGVSVAGLECLSSFFFSAVVTATPPLARRFQALGRVAVVHNYPLIEEFATSVRQRAVGNYFVYLGMAIMEERGAKELVEAIALLPAGLSAKLVLIGAFEPPQFRDLLQALPGWKKTDAIGLVDRKRAADVLSQAVAGLITLHPHPNFLNAFPVKLFEYMAAGVPVIASDFLVCRGIVEEARCGLFVNPRNAKEVAAAMAYLLTHPEEAQAMGERGREAVLRKFNWTKEQETLLELYSELLSPAERPAREPRQQELP